MKKITMLLICIFLIQNCFALAPKSIFQSNQLEEKKSHKTDETKRHSIFDIPDKSPFSDDINEDIAIDLKLMEDLKVPSPIKREIISQSPIMRPSVGLSRASNVEQQQIKIKRNKISIFKKIKRIIKNKFFKIILHKKIKTTLQINCKNNRFLSMSV